MSLTDFRYRMYGCTDPGRVRSNNEDALAFDAPHGVCVLADGLGGYNAGEVASAQVTSGILSGLTRWLAVQGPCPASEHVAAELMDCVAQAHRQLIEAAGREPSYKGMASTVVVGIFLGPQVVLGHVGDSRAYRWRRGELVQLTRDHSFVQEQLDAGQLTGAQAAASTQRNLVTRALGIGSQVQPELQILAVEADDLFLLCSDGLTDMVGDPELARIMAQPGSLAECARALIDAANANGGRDNVTVLLVHAGSACRTMS